MALNITGDIQGQGGVGGGPGTIPGLQNASPQQPSISPNFQQRFQQRGAGETLLNAQTGEITPFIFGNAGNAGQSNSLGQIFIDQGIADKSTFASNPEFQGGETPAQLAKQNLSASSLFANPEGFGSGLQQGNFGLPVSAFGQDTSRARFNQIGSPPEGQNLTFGAGAPTQQASSAFGGAGQLPQAGSQFQKPTTNTGIGFI